MTSRLVLVPTDFSKGSEVALEAALAWVDPAKDRIALLHVVIPMTWPTPETQRLRVGLLEAADSQLRDLAKRRVQSRVRTEVHVVEGTPHQAIASFAAQRHADLLVLATHGHSALKRYLLGSTTERLIRSSPCSVLVVRRGKATSSGEDGLRHLLVGTDFSEHAGRALDRAVELASRTGGKIVLLHVIRDIDLPTQQVLHPLGFPRLHEEFERRAERWLERLRSEHVGDKVPTEIVLTTGVPSAAIVDTAAARAIDLLVLGSHGRSGVQQFMLGSTVERAARVATCSVLIVK